MGRHIATVEDEPRIRENHADPCRRPGSLVDTHVDHQTADRALRRERPNQVVLAFGLGDVADGGLGLCRERRGLATRRPTTSPTTRDDDIDTITGLRIGAGRRLAH